VLCLGVVVSALIVGPTLGPPVAYAATPCSGQVRPPAAQPVTGTPWEQARYDLSRLDGIADGRGVLVAVLDSGVAADQPQLRGRLLGGGDWVADGDGLQDCLGHGTAVASIIAAAPVDGSPLRGVAPGARILSLRVTEHVAEQPNSGRTPKSAQALPAAVRTAVDAGARVINISMTVTGTDELDQAIGYAVGHGAVVVAAVGNGHARDGGDDPTPYPAGYPGVIGVASIGPDGHRAASSQLGGYVRLAAPGEPVTAAVPAGGVATFAGTSFAAPFVAGAAALVLQRYRDRNLTPAQVAARLYATADPAPDGAHSTGYGHGVVNPYRAVTAGWTSPAPDSAAAQPPVPTPVARSVAPGHRTGVFVAAGAGVLALAVLLLLASALPRGARRHWRPGV
jgi:membrane-anchored mycosin MYCP